MCGKKILWPKDGFVLSKKSLLFWIRADHNLTKIQEGWNTGGFFSFLYKITGDFSPAPDGRDLASVNGQFPPEKQMHLDSPGAASASHPLKPSPKSTALQQQGRIYLCCAEGNGQQRGFSTSWSISVFIWASCGSPSPKMPFLQN